MQKKGLLRGLILFALGSALLAGGLVISSLFREAGLFQRSEYIMGTIFDITAVTGDGKAFEGAAAKAFEEIKRIDAMMSRLNEKSEVSLINRNAGNSPVKVGQDLMKVLKEAVAVSELSDGAFDVTIGPLSSLWGFDEDRKTVPTDKEIDGLRKLVDYRRLRMDEAASTVYLEKRGMMIDLGGIAKGYALKKAVKAFEDADIRNVIINAGGNLNLRGTKRGKSWKVGIQDPRDESKLLGILNITDTSVSTSGDYQRYFIKDSIRYHHILDPKTGHPSKGPISVTIAGRNEAMTDALSTALFVLGAEKGAELMKKIGAEWIMVTEDGKITVSEGFKEGFSRKP